MSRVAEILRQDKGIRAVVDDLLAQAALLRQLRNYGVHPRGSENDHLERYLRESGATILLLQTHTYMNRLKNATAARLSTEDVGSGD